MLREKKTILVFAEKSYWAERLLDKDVVRWRKERNELGLELLYMRSVRKCVKGKRNWLELKLERLTRLKLTGMKLWHYSRWSKAVSRKWFYGIVCKFVCWKIR